jgi:hypothetical protein
VTPAGNQNASSIEDNLVGEIASLAKTFQKNPQQLRSVFGIGCSDPIRRDCHNDTLGTDRRVRELKRRLGIRAFLAEKQAGIRRYDSTATGA